MENLQPWQQRVVEEKEELDRKLTSLDTFLEDEQFSVLSEEDKSLLRQQAGIMRSYSGILEVRIARF